VSRRSLFILLFVSLALNLFILGAAAGAFLFGARFHERPSQFRGGGNPMLAAAQALPDDQREPYREALRSGAMAVGPKLRDARMLRHDAWLRLGADPVDAAAVTADLDRARALETEARGEVDRAIVGFAAKLPAGQRGALGAALANPPQRRGPRPPPPPQP
jgi:uncharacterized membrane protein